MLRKTASMSVTGAFLLVTLIAILFVSPKKTGAQTGNALASPTPDTSRAFADKAVPSVRGTKVDIWTAQQPAQNRFVSSPSGICTDPICKVGSPGFVETGYYKGMGSPVQNQLQQYVTYKNINGIPEPVWGLGNLNDNTWYTFQTLYSQTAQRWEAWRNGQLVWYVPTPLNFTQGALVRCGAEGKPIGVQLGVEVENMRYKLTGGNTWILYNYTDTFIEGPYCVFKPAEFGAFGWGPC